MSYKFLKSVKFIKSMFPAGTFFRITEATDGKYVYNCLTYYFLHFLATTLSFPGFTFETG